MRILPFVVLPLFVTAGCAGWNPFLSIPVGFAETKAQSVVVVSAPPTAKSGEVVHVGLRVWFPGSECWSYSYTDVTVDEAVRIVTLTPQMTFTPTVADRYFGRTCLDSTKDVEATFTPHGIGRYTLNAPSHLQSSPATTTVDVSD